MLWRHYTAIHTTQTITDGGLFSHPSKHILRGYTTSKTPRQRGDISMTAPQHQHDTSQVVQYLAREDLAEAYRHHVLQLMPRRESRRAAAARCSGCRVEGTVVSPGAHNMCTVLLLAVKNLGPIG